MLQGLAALAADPRTRVIVLISKPPAPAIARRILEPRRGRASRWSCTFLGADACAARGAGLVAADSLQHAGDVAVALAGGSARAENSAGPRPRRRGDRDAAARDGAAAAAVRGFFTGGTFCYGRSSPSSRPGLAVPLERAGRRRAAASRPLTATAFIDIGDDDSPRQAAPDARPVPAERGVRTQAADLASASILFDVVLGYGSPPTPPRSCRSVLRGPREAGPRGARWRHRPRLRHRRRSAGPRRADQAAGKQRRRHGSRQQLRGGGAGRDVGN